MSAFFLEMVAINPKREEVRSESVRLMVDSGSQLSWLPAEVLATRLDPNSCPCSPG